jgi:hypothetical protein
MILLLLVTQIPSLGRFSAGESASAFAEDIFLYGRLTMKVSAETQTHEHYFQEIHATRLSDDKLDAYKLLCPSEKTLA